MIWIIIACVCIYTVMAMLTKKFIYTYYPEVTDDDEGEYAAQILSLAWPVVWIVAAAGILVRIIKKK